jgi:DNA-binding NarL/FixJ family response regulator
MNQKIRILLVDDQVLFREGLRTLLEVQDDFDVIGEASNGKKHCGWLLRSHPMSF